MNAKLLYVFLMSLTGVSLLARGDQITFKSTKVAEGLYMLEGVGGFSGGNLGLSVGSEGVVLIDDSMPPMTAAMNAAIATLTKDPVKFLINTHVHFDHTGGNEALGKAGAIIVAHENIRHRMLTEGISTGSVSVPAAKEALPVLTFTDEVTFHLNGKEARVFHAAHAHTDGDAVIHFSKVDVIHTGDIMFNGMYPFIDLNAGGSVDGYIAAQEKILSLASDNTKIIPGHGPLASKKDLEACLAMLKDVRAKVMALLKMGKSEAEILAANPLASYDKEWTWQFITTEKMTKTLINSLKK